MRTVLRATRPAVLALLLSVSALLCAAEKEAPVCLLTGFDLFADFKTNASWDTAKALDGKTIAGYRVVAVKLPVVYDEMAAPLAEALEQHKPELVISMGVGTETVQLETLARNGYHHGKPKDNKKKAPPREKIAPDGADTIPTALPAPALLAAWKEAGITAKDSDDAGGYLCNECFYRLMAYSGPAAKTIRARGFIHVPAVGWPDPAGGEFTAEKLQKAITLAIEQTAKSVTK